MEPQKFRAQIKCECYGSSQCTCPKKSASSALFMENIRDIAKTLGDIMIICGIHEAKAKASSEVIVYSFLHYDEIRHRIDAVPRKRLCKEDLIHELGRKCLMNRMEAQLTYSIIKRAFKAFYHGTTEGGLRNRALESELLHTQECYWVHAAKRTAQIFANYEGMFFSAQKTYESLIRCAYKKLYDRLVSRYVPNVTTECECKACARNIWGDGNDGTTRSRKDLLMYMSNIQLQPAVRVDGLLATTCPINKEIGFLCGMDSNSLLLDDFKNRSSNVEFNLPRCYKCNCPKLVCDCDVDRDTGVLSTDCSQGPYKCQWIRVDKDDEKPDPCITIPENHQCPVDCDEVSRVTCDSECVCDCVSCECVNEEESSGYDDDDAAVEDEAFDGNEEEQVADEDNEPLPVDMTDISERQPTPRYGGCRVPVNHIVEEVKSDHPASIATVEEHRNSRGIVSSEPVRSKIPISTMSKGATPKRYVTEAVEQPVTANELIKDKTTNAKVESKHDGAKTFNSQTTKAKPTEVKSQEMTQEERRKEGFLCASSIFMLWTRHLVLVYMFVISLGLTFLSYWSNVSALALVEKNPFILEDVLSFNTTRLLETGGMAMSIMPHIIAQWFMGMLFAYIHLGPRYDLLQKLMPHIFASPILCALLPIPPHVLKYIPVIADIIPLILTQITLMSSAMEAGKTVYNGYQYSMNFVSNFGLSALIENEWQRLNVPSVLRVFWTIRMTQALFSIMMNESINSINLLPTMQKLLVDGCETLTAVLGMTSVVSIICHYIGKIFQWYLLTFNSDEEKSLGTVSAVLFYILALQTGLTSLSPEKRFVRLCRNLCLLITALLHFLHNIVSPILMSLSAARNPSRKRHIRALTVCAFLIVVPICLLTFLWSRHSPSTWLLAVTAFSVEVIVKVLVSLATYTLFLLDARRQSFWEKLDDYLYYVRAFGNSVEFCFGILLFFNGAWILLFESGGAIRAIMMCIHAYFNIWCEARAGWSVFIKRRAAVHKISALPEATPEQLVNFDDVCAICYQEMFSAKITRCRHFFHGVCLRKWLYVQDRCPLCHEIMMYTEKSDDNEIRQAVDAAAPLQIYPRDNPNPPDGHQNSPERVIAALANSVQTAAATSTDSMLSAPSTALLPTPSSSTTSSSDTSAAAAAAIATAAASNTTAHTVRLPPDVGIHN